MIISAFYRYNNLINAHTASTKARFWRTVYDFFLDPSESVEFTEFEPYQFRRVRLAGGITDAIYSKYESTEIMFIIKFCAYIGHFNVQCVNSPHFFVFFCVLFIYQIKFHLVYKFYSVLFIFLTLCSDIFPLQSRSV